MLTTAQIEKIITDAIDSDEAQSLNRSPASIAAEKIAELTKSDADMLVAAQALENEVTSTLVDMVVATVLATLIYEEGGGRSNMHISPKAMDDMVKNWNYTSAIENGLRTVSISLKPDSPLAKEFADERENLANDPAPGVMRDESISLEGIKPQADEKVYDRPVWAVKTTVHDAINDDMVPVLRNCHDRADAERQCLLLLKSGRIAAVENRYCLHPECPSTGCTMSEATSDADKG